MKKILGVVLATVLASVPAAAANGIQHALRSPLTLDAFEEISFYAGIGYHPLARTNYRLAGDKTSFSGDAIGFSLGIEKGYTRGEVAYTRYGFDYGSLNNGIPKGNDHYFEGTQHSLMLNGFYNFFEPGTGVIPYMGMGFGTTRLRYDERIEMMNGEGLYTWHDKSLFTYMLGAGFLFEVNNNISLDVGYRYNRVANSTFKQRSYVDTDDDVGTLELLPLRNMATQSIMLTLKINLLERTIRKPYDGQFQSRP